MVIQGNCLNPMALHRRKSIQISAPSTLMGKVTKQLRIRKQRGEERVIPKFVSESPMCTKYRMLLVVEEFQRILFQLAQVQQYKLININKCLTRTV